MINRVRNSGVFRDRTIAVVHLAVILYHYIFQKCISFYRPKNIWFFFRRKVYYFRVAASLVVEHAIIIPAVLIITDKVSFRVGRKRSFSCSRKPEEHRYIIFFADICRTVHRRHSFQWKVVVHHREHSLFHLASVPSSSDNLSFFCKVKHHKVL